MKILITGDREWDNEDAIIDAYEDACLNWHTYPSDITLCHGNCRGADVQAGHIAEQLGMTVVPFQAHWQHTPNCPPKCKEVIGRAAGVIRNQKMLDDNSDITLALVFHSNLEESKGTADMVRRLKKAGIPYKHIVK